MTGYIIPNYMYLNLDFRVKHSENEVEHFVLGLFAESLSKLVQCSQHERILYRSIDEPEVDSLTATTTGCYIPSCLLTEFAGGVPTYNPYSTRVAEGTKHGAPSSQHIQHHRTKVAGMELHVSLQES